MTAEELNTALRMEIIHYRETDNITQELKSLLMILILQESEKRLSKVSDTVRISCESEAYIACCKHCIHYNPDVKSKSDTPAISYVRTIIRCAFADTLHKEAWHEKTYIATEDLDV